jgi:cytoskeletal protein CcmA (bactofilin family)
MGETVTVDGTINGDLLAFGGEVTVRGNVTGNLVTGAQSVTIEGTVGGSVLGGAEELTLENARIGRDLYGFGNEVEIASTTNVSGNAITAGERVDVNGRVGIDLRSFGSALTVRGAVEGDFDAHGREVRLESTARVGGNVTGHVASAGNLSIVDGATVGGTVSEEVNELEERRNRYVNPGHYFGQIIRLAGAFLTGLMLLWLVPILRDVSLPNAMAVLRSAGIGLAAAVTLPVAALIVCVTIVGIPLGVLTFLLGAIGLYFSKAVIAQIIGRGVLRDRLTPPHYAATLFVGLVIVIVAINLPWIGGFANLVLTLTGFGVIVSLIFARLNRGATV